ncbi:MAG TPA: P-II family nitrogen regulator [Firmicutes bacterium]|jgi:nitrogen regulatory protein PII|nr:P-II family nitrogen regulator [Bacillota bacterium]
MDKHREELEFSLIYVVVDYGQGSKILAHAKRSGVTGGTIFFGKGTVHNRLLEFLSLTEIRKEIVLMVAEKNVARQALFEINKEFSLAKPNHGIAFSIPVINFFGSHTFGDQPFKENRGVIKNMYNAVFVIVDKGKGEAVIDAAKEKGAKGGTIIHARGSGIHKSIKLFGMEIEPEKDIALILCEQQLTAGIVTHIRAELHIDQPGNGIIFTQRVEETYGLRKE